MCGKINFSGRSYKPGDKIPAISTHANTNLRFGHNMGRTYRYNARLETLKRKNENYEKVIVPFDYFVEKGKKIYRANENYYLAGVRNKDGEVAIITVAPSEGFAKSVHHRRPALVTKDWLYNNEYDENASIKGVLSSKKKQAA
jgi:hypothetical protein